MSKRLRATPAKIASRIYRSHKLHGWFMALCGVLPLQKKVVFSSYAGSYFSDSPLAIYRELQSRRARVRCVWLSNRKGAKLDGAKVVGFSGYRACYHLATARCWVDNQRKPEWVRKRAGQFYIQTWHSGLTNKSGEGDEEAKLDRGYVREAKHDSQMADLFVSGSRWQTAHYRRAFWYDGEILESGLPRSDVFFRPAEPIRERVYRWFGLEEDERVVLYAPTFRNGYRLDAYNLDCAALLEALRERFGGRWRALVRLHPNIAGRYEAFSYGGGALDASRYPDINELIAASEWLITDYSSCAFDALEAGKRAALYAPDMEDYRRERGFYWEFEELPFLVAKSNAELCASIERFDEVAYAREVANFLEKCGLFDDGRASERVVNRLLEEAAKKRRR